MFFKPTLNFRMGQANWCLTAAFPRRDVIPPILHLTGDRPLLTCRQTSAARRSDDMPVSQRSMAFLPGLNASSFLRHARPFHACPPSLAPRLSLRHFAPNTKRIRKPKSLVAPPGTAVPRNIAVVGGGLAGLAVTYHLLYSTARYARKRGFDADSLRITILDARAPGEGGATAAAAGLLHPFTPRAKKKVWKPVRSMDAALSLVRIAQEKTPGRCIVRFPGLLRLALTDKMHTDFQQAAHRFPKEIQFLEAEEVRQRFSGAPEGVCGALIRDAAVVDTSAYVRNLWQVCEESGRVRWQREDVSNVSALLEGGTTADGGGMASNGAQSTSFDTVILCAGASIKAIREFRDIPLTACRGQNLHLESARPDATLGTPVISGKYVVPEYFSGGSDAQVDETVDRGVQRIIAGATFEYKDSDQSEAEFLEESCKNDVARATSELDEPLHRLVPNLYDGWNITGSSSGTRALPPRSVEGSIPIACRVSGTREDVSCWVFTGLGSRGLLHHAYLGRMLAHAVVAGNEGLIPSDARRFPLEMGKSDD